VPSNRVFEQNAIFSKSILASIIRFVINPDYGREKVYVLQEILYYAFVNIALSWQRNIKHFSRRK